MDSNICRIVRISHILTTMMILLPGSGPLHAILHSIAYAPASAMKPEDRGATASLLATTRYKDLR